MSKLTLNIVEPASPTPTPVDPSGSIDPSVPSTGLFTHGIGGTEATIIAIVSAVLLLTIAAIVIAVLYKKHKKQNKTTKLVHMVDTCKSIAKSKKRITASLTAIALLVSAGTFIALAKNAVNAADTDEQAEGEDDSSLTVNVSEEELTIELGDDPVFAVLPVEVSVEEATQTGYTLTAYTDSTDLVSTTDPDNTIPMIAVEGDELEALTDNTYGLALGEEPTSKDAEAYTTLYTDQSNPTIIKSMPEYTPTEENDTTTIYYGFYITPDIPYGTYTNDSDIYYNATINTTPVTFDGNGLYFNEDEQQTTNEVEYIAVPEEGKEYNINQIVSGEYKEPSQDLPCNFLGWSIDPEATVPTYTSEQSIAEFLPILPNTPLTLYAVWQKATTITFNGNGADSGTMDTQTIIAGESDSLYENTFVKDGYHFTGWNTVAEPTEQEPGESYTDQADYTAPATSQNLILYAQWEKLPVIGDLTYMQDFATLSEISKTSVLNSMTAGEQYQLKDNRDQKNYYVSKLADNNIWMTQNLDLNIEAGRTYTSADTDLANSTISTTWTPTSSTYSTGTTTWNGSDTAPESYDPGAVCWNGTPGSSTTGGCNENNSHYHLGNYYNWTAAVAMSDSSGKNSGDMNQSICPAGWRLPTYSGNKSYENLVNTQDLSAGTSGNIQSAPTYFVYSGHWYGYFSNDGYFGSYWSSVVDSRYYAYLLRFNVDSNLYPQFSSGRSYGYSVRCVAR